MEEQRLVSCICVGSSLQRYRHCAKVMFLNGQTKRLMKLNRGMHSRHLGLCGGGRCFPALLEEKEAAKSSSSKRANAGSTSTRDTIRGGGS